MSETFVHKLWWTAWSVQWIGDRFISCRGWPDRGITCPAVPRPALLTRDGTVPVINAMKNWTRFCGQQACLLMEWCNLHCIRVTISVGYLLNFFLRKFRDDKILGFPCWSSGRKLECWATGLPFYSRPELSVLGFFHQELRGIYLSLVYGNRLASYYMGLEI